MQSANENRIQIKDLLDGRSLFSRLFTYRGRENVNPEENFFTEGLSYILDKDRNLLQKFVDFIRNRFANETLMESFFWKNAVVRTQSFYRNNNGTNNFIDLEIEFEEALLWIEVKVESNLSGEDQIQKYEDLMGEIKNIAHKKSGIILLTKHTVNPPSRNKFYLGNIKWSELFGMIDEHLNTEDAPPSMRLIEENYLKLLEEKNMAQFEPFSENEKLSSITMEKVDAKVGNILDNIYETLRNGFGKDFQYSRQSEGKGYVGQKVHINEIEIFYAVVTRGNRFGSIDMWFIPNQNQIKLIQSTNESPVSIGFEEQGGSYIFKSKENDLKSIGNKNYLAESSELVFIKTKELIEQLGN